MANVELPIFPSKINCLAWSQEGDLAVAAGEYVYILVSQRQRQPQLFVTNHGRSPIV